jgi:hypothetical protein
MKPFIAIATAVLLGALVYYLVSRDHPSAPSAPSVPSVPSALPTATLTDAAEIFQKAFWKRATAGDEILHAERREWSDAEGVAKWQWFIAVKTSPELLKYLRDDNAFGLVPAQSAVVPDEKPAWFSFDPSEVSVLTSPRGNMQLVFQTRDNTLYATDAGGGLQRGAPEPAPPVQSPQTPGRLPTTSPPAPKS